MTPIPNLRFEDAFLLMVMGFGLLIIFRMIKPRGAVLLITFTAAGYAMIPSLAERSNSLPSWVSVLIIIWVGYTLVRVLAGLLLGKAVGDQLLANTLTLLLIGPICAFFSMLRNRFRGQ